MLLWNPEGRRQRDRIGLMIRRLADAVKISCHCEHLGSEFVYSMKIVYGRRALRVSRGQIPLDTDRIRDLLGLWADGLAAQEALRNTRHLAELGPYILGENIEVRLRRTRELDDQKSASRREIEVSIERAREALERQLEAIPFESPLTMTCEGRYYTLHHAALWTSTRRLDSEQWMGLITQAINREEAKLASLAALTGEERESRPTIPSPVRVEVWRRDGGRCVRCASRDRLEFDHIIPLARGGGNTSRNIELLCEACNRAKSASIS